MRRRDAGESVEAMAVERQVSKSRIHTRIHHARRVTRLEASASEPNELNYLSVWSRNCLVTWGIETRAQAKAALDGGDLKKVPNLGAKSMAEVLQWIAELGVDQAGGTSSGHS